MLTLKILDQKICMTMLTYELPVIYLCLKSKLGTKDMIGCARRRQLIFMIFVKVNFL